MKLPVLLAFFIFLMFNELVAQTKKTQTKKASSVKTAVKKAPVKKPVKKLPAKPVAKKPLPKKEAVSNERMIEITTDIGVMVAKLYDSTPLHRDNFVKLVEAGFYDSLLYHRVIDLFMIQGGDPNSKNAADGQMLGNGSAPGERIPAEFKPSLFHKKGALAAARDNNPAMASSNCQYYIVQGRKYTNPELDNILAQRVAQANPTFKYTPAQREAYKVIGGTPFLDQSYTVFGEVVSGLDVIDKIAQLPKDQANRPLQNIRMKIRLLK